MALGSPLVLAHAHSQQIFVIHAHTITQVDAIIYIPQ
jgi:hypothetical protein